MNRESVLSYHILSHIEKDNLISQRKLSKRIGLNISSVNYSLKKLISRGYVKMQGMNPRRITYHLTSQGLSEKTQLAYKYFLENYHLYQDVRSDIALKIEKIDKRKGHRIAVYGITPYFDIIYAVLIENGFKINGIFDNEGETVPLIGTKYGIKNITKLKIEDVDYILELKDLSTVLNRFFSNDKSHVNAVTRIKLF